VGRTDRCWGWTYRYLGIEGERKLEPERVGFVGSFEPKVDRIGSLGEMGNRDRGNSHSNHRRDGDVARVAFALLGLEDAKGRPAMEDEIVEDQMRLRR